MPSCTGARSSGWSPTESSGSDRSGVPLLPGQLHVVALLPALPERGRVDRRDGQGGSPPARGGRGAPERRPRGVALRVVRARRGARVTGRVGARARPAPHRPRLLLPRDPVLPVVGGVPGERGRAKGEGVRP